MIAKYKIADNKILDIYFFAMLDKGADTKVVFFCEEENKLKIVNYYTQYKREITRAIFQMAPDGNWQYGEEISGYDWFIASGIDKIRSGNVSIDILNRCKKLQADLIVQKWHRLENEYDFACLLHSAYNFHGSYPQKIEKKNGSTFLTFTNCWGCDIIIRIDGVSRTNLFDARQNNYFYSIFSCSLFAEKGNICWVDRAQVDCLFDITDGDRYFIAEKAFWSIDIK